MALYERDRERERERERARERERERQRERERESAREIGTQEGGREVGGLEPFGQVREHHLPRSAAANDLRSSAGLCHGTGTGRVGGFAAQGRVCKIQTKSERY